MFSKKRKARTEALSQLVESLPSALAVLLPYGIKHVKWTSVNPDL